MYKVAALVLVALAAGFAAGLTLAGQTGWMLAGSREPEMTQAPAAQAPPPAENPDMPSEDIPGADIAGLDRYPGSVRIEHVREDLGDVIATEVEYLTPAKGEVVREFYRDLFRTEGWSVGDVGFARGAWTFLVIQDGREAFIELKPRGGDLVEIDVEITESKPQAPEQTPEEPGPTPAYDDDYDEGFEGGED